MGIAKRYVITYLEKYCTYLTLAIHAIQNSPRLAAPDPFTASSESIKAGSRKVGEMKLGKKTRYNVSSISITDT